MSIKHVAAALALIVSTPIWAGASVVCINSNIDIWNRTGQTANDLEISVGGVTAAQVGDFGCGNFYNGPFDAPTVTDVAGGVTIRWSGATIPDDAKVHVGYSLLGNPTFSSYSVNWTFDGNIIVPTPDDPRPDPAQFWRGRNLDVIQNFGAYPIWVQRRGLTTPGIVRVEDLLVGSTLDLASTAIDLTPQLLAVGATLEYSFNQTINLPESYVMIYDVFANENSSPGTLLATYLNAQDVPEPGILSLGLLGGAFLVRRRRAAGVKGKRVGG